MSEGNDIWLGMAIQCYITAILMLFGFKVNHWQQVLAGLVLIICWGLSRQ